MSDRARTTGERAQAAALAAARACRALRAPAAFVFAEDHTVVWNDAYATRFGVAPCGEGSRAPAESLWSREWREIQGLLAATLDAGLLFWSGEARESSRILRGAIWFVSIPAAERSIGILCAWLSDEQAGGRLRRPERADPDAGIEIDANDPIALLALAIEGEDLRGRESIRRMASDAARGEHCAIGDREPVPVGRLLRDAIVIERAVLEERRQLVSIAMDEPGLEIAVDRNAVVHALANFLAEAARDAPPGGSIEIFALRSRDGDATVDLGVRGFGVGVLAEPVDGAWEEFPRLSRWPLEHEIALAHGGELCAAVESQEHGAIVCLRLPVRDREVPAAAPVRERPLRAVPRRRRRTHLHDASRG